MEGEQTRNVIAHRLDHRVLAVDAHDDELQGGVAMHLDAVTHIQTRTGSVCKPPISAGFDSIMLRLPHRARQALCR